MLVQLWIVRTIGIESEEPVFLLVVGHDVNQCGCPFDAVDILQFLEIDLDGLAIGRGHGQKMDAFGILDVVWRLICVEVVRHGCCFLLSFFFVLSTTKSNAFKKWHFGILLEVKLLLRVKTSLTDWMRSGNSRSPSKAFVQALTMMMN